MINRLRKDLDNVGSYNPGMADGGMVPHDDMSQDADMIKSVLQKICDEMDSMEANRIHPKMTVMKLSEGSEGIPNPNENSAETPMQAEPEDHEGEDNQHGPLDSNVLQQLLEKATTADDQGSLPEDQENAFPSEIQDAINKKRGRHK